MTRECTFFLGTAMQIVYVLPVIIIIIFGFRALISLKFQMRLIYCSLYRLNFISYLFISFEVAAVKILLQCITSTWSNLQRPWHLYLICMMQIAIPILYTQMKLSFVLFMCYFIWILTASPWLISIHLFYFRSFLSFLVWSPLYMNYSLFWS